MCRLDGGRTMTFPSDPDAILTRAEVADWLKVRPRQVERLGVPCLDLGRKTKRYVLKDVLAWLEATREAHSYARRRSRSQQARSSATASGTSLSPEAQR